MKIAIIGPSPVPFTVGGIENMMWGIYNAINQKTPHQAELIKLPSREHSFWELLQTYYDFYKLDVSHFDAVIVAKYPAWMVKHSNCIFYVAHRLRGLYDTYHLMNLPYDIERGNEKIDRILDYMSQNPHPIDLDEFFLLLFQLKQTAGKSEESFLTFPGPFIRSIIHYLDNYGFSQHDHSVYYSISDTVKSRAEYFPVGAEVETIYLPSSKKDYSVGEYKHIFMISRLDSAKRIDILIQAMKYVKSNTHLYLAGTGPEKQKLKACASGDKRIHFLGFISDEEVEEYYANSLVIPFFPYAEDYGLITIEAMMHKKPVITTVDAGGPTEFVVNGETGFVTEFDPKAIAEKIDYFAKHPEEAKRMGEKAYERVKDITWEATVNRLLETVEMQPPSHKKMTLTSTFSIYPATGGGQVRTLYLYREVAKRMNVEIVSYGDSGQSRFEGMIEKGVKEIRIPRTDKHQQKVWQLERKVGIPVGDISEITLGAETKDYLEALKKSIDSSDFVVFSHPYLYPVGKQFLKEKPYIYDAQDVEWEQKKGMLPECSLKKNLLDQIFDAEKECCLHAKLVITCSEEDRQKLHELYGTPLEKMIVVPNGVDTSATKFVSPEQRQKNKEALGLAEEKIGLFMGSWHGPNLEACEMIFEIAKKCPDTKFMLMGSQCAYFKDREIPDNVAMLGLVSEEAKNRIFSVVDFALNPMLSGSGTNLKMFDYMSAGIPIITTAFGTRGIEEKTVFMLADSVDEFAAAIHEYVLNTEQKNRIAEARKYVEQVFDWKVAVKPLLEEIEKM